MRVIKVLRYIGCSVVMLGLLGALPAAAGTTSSCNCWEGDMICVFMDEETQDVQGYLFWEDHPDC